MGGFVQTAIIKNCNKEKIKIILRELQDMTNNIIDLDYKQCQYKEIKDDLLILFNNDCIGYEELAKNIAKKIDNPILLLYTYDDDYWGYYFYERGNQIDCFNQEPDYFEEISEEEKEKLKGNAEVIANYFNINKEEIENYLKFKNDEEDEDIKAYEDDKFEVWDCWQMTDFMRKLGFEFDFELE